MYIQCIYSTVIKCLLVLVLLKSVFSQVDSRSAIRFIQCAGSNSSCQLEFTLIAVVLVRHLPAWVCVCMNIYRYICGIVYIASYYIYWVLGYESKVTNSWVRSSIVPMWEKRVREMWGIMVYTDGVVVTIWGWVIGRCGVCIYSGMEWVSVMCGSTGSGSSIIAVAVVEDGRSILLQR